MQFGLRLNHLLVANLPTLAPAFSRPWARAGWRGGACETGVGGWVGLGGGRGGGRAAPHTFTTTRSLPTGAAVRRTVSRPPPSTPA